MLFGENYTSMMFIPEKEFRVHKKFKVVSLNRNVIRCYSDTTGVAHAFEYSEYGDRFFLTEKELLSAYEI